MTRSTNSRKLRIESLEVRNLLAVVAGGTEEVTLSPDPTEATTWVVNTTDDPVAGNPYDSILSLREAIERAATGDRIVFGSSLIGKTITFSDDMNTEGYYIGNGITIDASSIGGITIVADGRVQVFGVTGGNSSNPVELINLTISGGHLTDNYCGGGINNHGTLILTNCTISGNSADQGGGIYNCGTLKLTDCTISGNSARSGAGIYNDYDGTLAITNCTISENSARSGGGVCNFGSLTIVNSAIERNTVDDSGGGIENGGTVILNNCTILGNSADKGGGIHNSIQGTLTVTNSAINGNTANGYGGGIYNYYQTKKLNFVNCSIFGNTARYDGGGFYGKQNLETSMFVNCAISGNTAGRYGGGVYNFGYANDPSAPLRFINCTITGNTSDQGGGICNNKNDTLTLTNTILSLNYANAYNDIYSIRSVSSSFNIIGPDPGFVVAPIFEDGKVINMDELDLTLTACSVAIDAGNNDVVTTETDLAGNKRIVNSIIDLGAFEYLKPSITDVSIAGWSGSYDGMAHSITVDDPDASTDTILYSTDGTTYDLTQIPQYTDVGTYTTYVMVSRSGYQDWYGSATVEIIPAIINDVTLTGWSGDHDSLAHSITVSDPHDATDTILYSTDGVNYNLTTCPEYFDEGTYTTYVRVIRRGYAHWEGSASVEIRHVSPIVTTLEDLVDNRDGKTSLREAIGLAIEGDLITFDTNLSGGTILLNGTQLEITKSISIDASSIGGVTINANEKSRVFYIHMSDGSDKDITLSGLTIKGGMNVDKGGGIYNQNSTLTLTNSIVSGNTANDNGGGFYNADGCILTLSNSTVSGNTAYGSGGGIYNLQNSTLTLTDSTVSENTADYGGGIYNLHNSTLTLINCTVSGNTANGSGGGIQNCSTLTLISSTVSENTADYGGGIHNITNSTLMLTDSTISENTADYGGGIYNYQNNTLTLTNSTVSENTANGSGGGIYNLQNITLILINSTVSGNIADQYGGGIYNYNYGTLTLTNCTVSGNTANGKGGGIYNRYFTDYGTSYLYNTIIAQNAAGSSGNDVYRQSGFLYAYNTVSSFTDWTASEGCLTYDSTRPLFADARNGDFTLASYSQAINKGNNSYVETDTDLAGNSRICFGTVDIGAYEFQRELPILNIVLTDWTGNFDDIEHSITVDDPDASTDTILYSTDGTTYDLTQIPQYTDVGTYTTYVMVSRSGYQDWYGSATVEIIPAIINDVTLTGWSGDHDSLAHSITVSDPHDATDTILYSTDGVNYNLTTCPEYFDEGTYTTYVRVIRRGYAHWEGSASVEIRHVSPIVTTLEDLVDNRDGKTSLREAIGLAIEGDLITFDTNLSGGTILLNGTQLEITKSISIDASSIGGVTINANEKSRVFYIHMSDGSDKDITLSGLTIKGGMNVDKGGGIYNQNSTLTLTNSIVSGNTANDNGGGFYNADGCILTLSNSTVSGNTAYGSGGGIYNSGTFNLYNSIIAENIAISSDDDICQISDYVYAFNTLSSFIDWTESGDCLVYDPTLPLFTDPEKDDFTLAPESQAYNVGNNSYVTTEVDLAGNRRICSRIVDLGAYEFQLTETPSTVVTTLEDVVDETDGLISLREAISYAKNGDVISFDFSLAGGTITLNGTQLEIAAAVTIDASDVGGVTIDANGKSRVFSISGGTTEIPVELINLTITGGNDAKGYGGGIYIEYGTLTMTNCTVSENSTNSSGGGICNNGGTLILTNSTISTNTAGEGGGILNNNGILTLAHCSIVKNIAYQKAGGGILNWGDSFLHLTNCLVSENYCYGEYGGGGIYNNEGTVTITKTIISENFTNKNSGGGISNSRGTMVLDGCTISNNTSSGFGGFGGGITNGGTMSISNCVVSGNTAEASFYGGGGIFNAKDLIMTNTVVSGNKAKLCGGGLYLISRGSNDSILINCTVTDNTAEGGGDGIAVVGTVCYYNSIIVQMVCLTLLMIQALNIPVFFMLTTHFPPSPIGQNQQTALSIIRPCLSLPIPKMGIIHW